MGANEKLDAALHPREALFQEVRNEHGGRDFIAWFVAQGDYCCEHGCGSGACELCPCCCAGWCVMGRDGIPSLDGIPGNEEDLTNWVDVASEHNPVAAALAAARRSQPAPRTVTAEDFRLAWHDTTCPEGADCRDRSLHTLGSEAIVGLILRTLTTLGITVEASP